MARKKGEPPPKKFAYCSLPSCGRTGPDVRWDQTLCRVLCNHCWACYSVQRKAYTFTPDADFPDIRQ